MTFILIYILLALLIIGISVFIHTRGIIESLSTRIMISFISAIMFTPVTKIIAIILITILLLAFNLAHIPFNLNGIDERHYHIAGAIWIATTYLFARIGNKIWLDKKTNKEPNQSPESTTTSVTPPAAQEARQP